jgi:FkbM family methyltransferase
MRMNTKDYEPAHFNSVRERMKHGDLFFDIGSYDATTSILVAEVVGPENVVIIEPTECNWPAIKANWEDHGLRAPRATFPGFLCDEDKPASDSRIKEGGFPSESNGKILAEKNMEFRWLNYRNVCAVVEGRPRLKIDTLTARVGAPRGITMDIEGSELLAIRGAYATLKNNNPIVWISIHPAFMAERFAHTAKELHDFMTSVGYIGALLQADHEEHWMFEKRS